MAHRPFRALLQHMHALLGAHGENGPAKALLERFAEHRDEAAFEALVERFGPLVHGVCRRVLGNEADVDDAFQATFLVLARKAGSIRDRESVGSWLYGVAYRVAGDARGKAARRRRHEGPAGDAMPTDPTSSGECSTNDSLGQSVESPQADPLVMAAWQETRSILDDELQRLPTRYRNSLVLCYLQGLTNEEAATALGCPVGSMSRLLARARELLHDRLVQRGVTLTAAVLGVILVKQAAPAAATSKLMKNTVAGALLYVAGKAVTAQPAALAEGAIKVMALARWKTTAAVLLLLCVTGMLVGLGTLHAWTADDVLAPHEAAAADGKGDEPEPPPPEIKPDPVEEFQQALRAQVRDPNNAEEIAFRKATLLQRAQKLQEVGDLGRALALDHWRDGDQNAAIAAVDGPLRAELVGRFEKGMRAALTDGTPTQKLGALALLGQMGVRIRAEKPEVLLARKLSSEIILQAQGDDPVVRQAAAQTLGLVYPDPLPATATLGKLLESDDVELRRAAAAALRSLLQTVRDLMGGRNFQVDLRPEQLALIVRIVAPLAGRGSGDRDAQVRALSVETCQLGAVILAVLAPDPPFLGFPPPGRKPSVEEQREIDEYRKLVVSERALVLPSVRALAMELPALGRAMDDAQANVVVEAGQALEAMIVLRQALLRRAASVPADAGAAARDGLGDDPLGAALQALVPQFARQLQRPEEQVRLAGVYALESLGPEAQAAGDALVAALADASVFVRWGAARALGKMAPHRAAKAVPALARLLTEENADLGITAAAALERYGPSAKAAVPALCKAVTHTDPATCGWAVKALGAIGPEAKEAVPCLIQALSAKDPELRLAAIRALGRLGPSARPGAAALTKALNDPDVNVRQAAAEAMVQLQ